jgi:hypothetical protein
MLADLAERQSFALIDPESGKLLKAWLFLVATGNCGGGGSNVKRLSDLLLGMKRGQASARDLPLEYTVDQVTCSRGHMPSPTGWYNRAPWAVVISTRLSPEPNLKRAEQSLYSATGSLRAICSAWFAPRGVAVPYHIDNQENASYSTNFCDAISHPRPSTREHDA